MFTQTTQMNDILMKGDSRLPNKRVTYICLVRTASQSLYCFSFDFQIKENMVSMRAGVMPYNDHPKKGEKKEKKKKTSQLL